jgi:hypothetical protein
VPEDIHKQVISKVKERFADILNGSKQSVYIFLDDLNKVCNKRFATLLGYESPDDWAAVEKNFPEAFVVPKDRQVLVSAYQSAMNDLVGSTISITWRKKKGGEVPSTTILVPIGYGGHKMALHFISPK